MLQYNNDPFAVPIGRRNSTIYLNKQKTIFAKRNQFPLAPACSLTIHKSQGGTFNEVGIQTTSACCAQVTSKMNVSIELVSEFLWKKAAFRQSLEIQFRAAYFSIEREHLTPKIVFTNDCQEMKKIIIFRETTEILKIFKLIILFVGFQ